MRIHVTLLLLAAAAAADDSVDRIFNVWDTNKDGVLTREELPDPGMFAKVDANADGKITPEEVGTFIKAGKAADAKKDAAAKGAKAKAATAKPPEKKSAARPIPEPRTVSERVDDFFRRYDLDRNKRVTKREFTADPDAWESYDRNNNGELTVREATRYIKATLRMAKRNPNPNNFFDLFDMNRDKKVTRREYDGPAAFFRRYDHNKDRTVTEAELNMGAVAGRIMRGDQEFMADGPTQMPKQGLLERYDANKDGRITLEELKNAESVMKRLDKNNDGVLSGSEVR